MSTTWTLERTTSFLLDCGLNPDGYGERLDGSPRLVDCCPNEHRCGCDDPIDEPEHAEGCRCPECDPDYNDPRTDEQREEEWRREQAETDRRLFERDERWRREQADIARRYWKYPDPRRSK